IFLTLGEFALSVFALALVPRQFFPSSDRPELLVDLSLPQNASIYATEATAKRFDGVLQGDPDVAQAVIVAKDVAARERLRVKLEKLLANDFPSLIARIYPLELGPPVGWPIQYRVSGPDLAKVRDLALEVARTVANNQHVVHTNFDWIEAARQLRIRINQDEA